MSSKTSFLAAGFPSRTRACVRLMSGGYAGRLGADPIADMQLLAPMHRGAAGIENFNASIKAALNPRTDGMRWAGTVFCVGDKIMQTRNNYDIDVFNGDMGRVVRVEGDNSGIVADFDGREVFLSKGDLSDFRQAYAISIHKSQGSEFPVVVMPLLRQHFIMLQRNLLYTGLTRARRKAFIVGDPSAWSAAVGNSRAAERRTFLRRRLESI